MDNDNRILGWIFFFSLIVSACNMFCSCEGRTTAEPNPSELIDITTYYADSLDSVSQHSPIYESYFIFPSN